jgi:hypothetical protein
MEGSITLGTVEAGKKDCISPGKKKVNNIFVLILYE